MLDIGKFIIAKWFFIAFAVGMLLNYIMKPEDMIIIEHKLTTDTLNELTNKVYKDKNDKCYKLVATKVEGFDGELIDHPMIIN